MSRTRHGPGSGSRRGFPIAPTAAAAPIAVTAAAVAGVAIGAATLGQCGRIPPMTTQRGASRGRRGA